MSSVRSVVHGVKSIVIRETRDRPARTFERRRPACRSNAERAGSRRRSRRRVGRYGRRRFDDGVRRSSVRAFATGVVVAPVRTMDRWTAECWHSRSRLNSTDGAMRRTVRRDGRGECLGVILLLQVRAIARLPRLPRRGGGRERRIIRARRDRCRPSAASGPARESPRSRPSSRRRPKSTPNRSASRSPRPRSGAPCTVKPSLARSRLR